MTIASILGTIGHVPLAVWLSGSFLAVVIVCVARTTSVPMSADTPPRIDVWGSHADCTIPYSLAVKIVEHIDPAGIFRSDRQLVLDGGQLYDLYKAGIPGLTFRERRALYRAGDIGLESAALSMSGTVRLNGCPRALIERSQERGRETGFVHEDVLNQIVLAASARRPAPAAERPRTSLLII